jgi:hypothetical protein
MTIATLMATAIVIVTTICMITLMFLTMTI